MHLKVIYNQFYESIYICTYNSSTLSLVGNFLATSIPRPPSQLKQTEIGISEKMVDWLLDEISSSRHCGISLPVPFNPGYHLQLLHIPEQQKLQVLLFKTLGILQQAYSHVQIQECRSGAHSSK